MDENHQCICSICRDEIINPRILPCWHAACFTCILSLTQNGQGRAVCCPFCRNTSLFENVRSLPAPINCVVCQRFVINPQKFPCCNGLCCLDCISRCGKSDGGISCPNDCRPGAKYTADDLSPASICPLCFSLHLDQARDCGHLLCRRCDPKTPDAPRNCYVCQAASSPPPQPVNPFSAVLPFQDVNANTLLHYLKQAGMKMIVFWIMILVTLLTYGFCYWTWIVGLFAMLALRFDLTLAVVSCGVIKFVIFFCSFYYFFQAASLFLISILSQRLLPRVHPLAPYVFEFLSLCILLPYYESIFIHRAILDATLGVLINFWGKMAINYLLH